MGPDPRQYLCLVLHLASWIWLAHGLGSGKGVESWCAGFY